ncbi:NAD(P)H-dependent glycerol-3-phosphate dehydrogenase [soil metagenome]
MSGRVAVIGAGSWGTALADLLAKNGADTVLWSYEPEVAEGISREHRNPRYLVEVPLHPSLRATADLGEALDGAGVAVSVSPSHAVRPVMGGAAPHLRDGALLVSASKGIENDTLLTMDGVLAEVVPAHAAGAVYLSGPSFAVEVAREHPTAVTAASHDPGAAERAQRLFQTDFLRVYNSTDVAGVELGGALKNVVAIAAGVVDGLGFGHNTRAALITRGLAEITRLGVALGAEPATFAGLAGMGDLVLTCTGGLSRNRTLGVELGKGRSLDEILGETTQVAEGVRTARAARELAHRTDTPMPIVEEVAAVLFEGRDPRRAMEALMLREPKPEQWG